MKENNNPSRKPLEIHVAILILSAVLAAVALLLLVTWNFAESWDQQYRTPATYTASVSKEVKHAAVLNILPPCNGQQIVEVVMFRGSRGVYSTFFTLVDASRPVHVGDPLKVADVSLMLEDKTIKHTWTVLM